MRWYSDVGWGTGANTCVDGPLERGDSTRSRLIRGAEVWMLDNAVPIQRHNSDDGESGHHPRPVPRDEPMRSHCGVDPAR